MSSDEGSLVYDSSSHEGDPDEEFEANLQRIRENDPQMKRLDVDGNFDYEQNMSDEEWEQLGHDIANNTHLKTVGVVDDALNDHKMSFLFRGLTRSDSIKDMNLCNNNLSVAGVRSMVPFLQNTNNFRELTLNFNNIESEGFNLMFRSLRDSPIEKLNCDNCGITTIEIDTGHIPRNLSRLVLHNNGINADGCRGLAKLLQGEDATLRELDLNDNAIDDEGVEILTNALRNNASLTVLSLTGNNRISKQGKIMLLKLVNDISSIEATLQSNHTLRYIYTVPFLEDDQIQGHIKMATMVNLRNIRNQEAAGKAKVLQFQLHSDRRAVLSELQGVTQSIYSEINPLHLPEVLALASQHHGQGELYTALKSTIAGVISTVNREQCLKQQRVYHNAIIAEHMAKVDAIDAELAAIEAEKGRVLHVESEHRSNKKRRV